MTDCTRCGKTGLQPDAIHTCTPLALVLADSISQMDTFTDYQRGQLLQAAAELRRLHAALAEQEPRPCHVFNVTKNGSLTEWEPTTMAFALPDGKHALYTAPQPAKREPLTDEEINEAYGDARVKWGHIPHDDVARIARAIERAHGIGGQS